MAKTKLTGGYPFVSYSKQTYEPVEMTKRSLELYEWMDIRRSVRDFSGKAASKEVINNIILTVSTAPSGAYKQP